jgi:hypothetical protein
MRRGVCLSCLFVGKGEMRGFFATLRMTRGLGSVEESEQRQTQMRGASRCVAWGAKYILSSWVGWRQRWGIYDIR